jgi:protein-histidine pros-kinase
MKAAVTSDGPRAAAIGAATVQHYTDGDDDLARFATLVSHDFSGPLRVIRGFSTLLRDSMGERLDDGERSYLAEIAVAAERMQALNHGLVTCVRARNTRLTFTQVDLGAVVDDCLAELASRILDRQTRVTVSPLPVVRADAAAIRLVLHHLIDNALRYASQGHVPTIEIAATTSATGCTVVVRDHGPGIAETSRERVFLLFKRLEPLLEPARPGIGLTLCRTLVERHGGRLWIDAAPGGGTEVVFTLPATAAAPAAAQPAGSPPGFDPVLGPGLAALAAIVESSADAIYSKDLDGRLLTWNRAAERMYGLTAEKAIGRHVSTLVPASRLEELPKVMTGIRGGEVQHLETVRVRKDGTLIDVSLTISPIRDAGGLIIAASVIARDITERHDREDQLRAILEVAPDAIVVINFTGTINAVNAQAEAVFGYSREELVGQPLEMLMPERYRDGHIAQRLAFAAKPVIRPMGSGLALFGLRRDGTEFPVDIQLSTLPTKDGILPVAAIRDVTERRRLEHLRDDFIGNAAHELRTPLTTLAGLGETLARNFDVMVRSDIEDAFAAMERQGDRAKVLIANLLDLSNVEGGRVDFKKQSVDLRALIDRVVEAAPPPDGKQVTVTVGDDLRVLADPDRLEQVVSNLLVNAYRYGGDTIRVDALREQSRVVFSVTDDGKGVAPDFIATIFEPFTRGKEANVVRGSGIGLALCLRIVKGMGGNIWYEASSPRGASFRVGLRHPS